MRDADLADRIVADAAGRRAIVLLDGGSGSGKTALAGRLAGLLADRLPGLQVVSLDDVYPGWEGLAAASEAVVTDILRADAPGHRRWDWVANVPTDWVPLDPTAPILVEGCGSITSGSARLATTTVWLELDEPTRKQRALDRDGDGYRPWWDAWAAQEAAHWRAHRPTELADLVIAIQ